MIKKMLIQTCAMVGISQQDLMEFNAKDMSRDTKKQMRRSKSDLATRTSANGEDLRLGRRSSRLETMVSQHYSRRLEELVSGGSSVQLTPTAWLTAQRDISRILDILEGKQRQRAKGTSRCGEHLRGVWTCFTAEHPLLQLLQRSLVYPWYLSAIVLTDAIFGSFALNALFLSNSAKSNTGGSDCPVLPLWANFFRDLILSLVTMVLTILPAKIIAHLHQQKVPLDEDTEKMKWRLWKRDVRHVVGV